MMSKTVNNNKQPRVREEYLNKLKRIRKGKFIRIENIDKYLQLS